MSAPRIVFLALLSFIGGVAAASFFDIPQFLLPALFLFGLVFLIFDAYLYIRSGTREKARIFFALGIFVFLFGFGIWRFQQAEKEAESSELSLFNDKKEQVKIIGQVVAEPDIRDQTIRLTIKPKSLELRNHKFLISSEKILIITQRYPEFEYGDFVQITGELLSVPIFEGFNYKEYLRTKGIYSVMYFPNIEFLGKESSWGISENLLKLKNKLKSVIYRNLSPPQSALLAALMFGDEGQFSKEWKEKLNRTGVRHVTAVSGMNITIISQLLFSLGLAIGLWRGQAFYFAIFLVVLYVLMVGAPASATRAGIMGAMLLLAQKVGRPNDAGRAVALAATAMVFLNPFLLRFDVGFQLSFLAIIGIIYLGPILQRLLSKIPNPGQLRNIIAMTVSASIFTMPILVYNFGYISVLGILVNILVVPLLSLITIFGFVFGFAGMIFEPFGQILSLPVWLLLTYITGVIDWFSKVPFISLTIGNVSWLWLPIFYGILGYATWKINQNQKLKFLE